MRVTPHPDSAHPDTTSPDTQSHAAADLPMSFLREERRLAGRALQSWRRHQRAAVPGFEATSLTVADPGGEALVLAAAPALQATFALTVGQSLARTTGPPKHARCRALRRLRSRRFGRPAHPLRSQPQRGGRQPGAGPRHRPAAHQPAP